jgi:rod shape-determining protein MreB
MKLLSDTVYVQVYKNRFKLRSIKKKEEIEVGATIPFSSKCLIVADFIPAEKLLKKTLGKLLGKGWFKPSPRVLIHPLEMVEGGLSPVEERILMELAIGAGARNAKVWVGDELLDQQVMKKIDKK